jgi:hypothetical protein
VLAFGRVVADGAPDAAKPRIWSSPSIRSLGRCCLVVSDAARHIVVQIDPSGEPAGGECAVTSLDPSTVGSFCGARPSKALVRVSDAGFGTHRGFMVVVNRYA